MACKLNDYTYCALEPEVGQIAENSAVIGRIQVAHALGSQSSELRSGVGGLPKADRKQGLSAERAWQRDPEQDTLIGTARRASCRLVQVLYFLERFAWKSPLKQ